MATSFGPEHGFIGIKLKFLEDWRLRVDMRHCLRSAVEDVDESGSKGASAPAKHDLMDVGVSSPKAEEPRRKKFTALR